METPTAFILNSAIASWRDDVSRSPNRRPENIAELEGHLRDSLAALQERGLSDEEAFLVATRRLGHPAKLESEFAKVNRHEVWLYRMLWMLIGIQVWGLVGTVSRTIGNTAVLGGLTSFGYHFQSYTHAPDAWSALGSLPALLSLLAQLLIMGACLAGGWWLARRAEAGASKLATKALRRPVLVGLAAVVLLLVTNSAGAVDRMLLQRIFSQNEVMTIVWSQTLAGLVLWPLQIVGFVALTIALLRRRLRAQQAA